MPTGMAVFLGILLIVVGLLLADVGRRSHSGTLARNWWIGIRTNATLAWDDAWEAAHRAGGMLLTIAAIGPIVGGLIVFFQPSNAVGASVMIIALGWLLVFVIVAGIKGQRAANAIDST